MKPAAAGILIVGHGTRNAAGQREFVELASQVAQNLAPLPTEACYLELVEPSIEAALAKLLQSEVERVVVVPVLLFAAGHQKNDIPAAMDEAVAKLRDSLPARFAWQQTPALGCHRALLEVSRDRFTASLAGAPSVSAAETVLVFVGRGSSDAMAVAETRGFAKLRADGGEVARAETSFMAVAEPHLSETLESVAQQGPARVVVQPHLLFEGQVLAEIAAAVNEARRAFPKVDWRLTRHLGPDPRIATALSAAVDDLLG